MTIKLPEPVTYEQMFLAAILAELRAIRRKTGRVAPARPVEGDEIELREPEPIRMRRKGKG